MKSKLLNDFFADLVLIDSSNNVEWFYSPKNRYFYYLDSDGEGGWTITEIRPSSIYYERMITAYSKQIESATTAN